MKILVDLLHPAHVHFFKHFIKEMKERGHECIVLSRKKDCTEALLTEYNIPHICLSTQKKGLHCLVLEFVTRLWRTVGIIRRERPDVLIGCMGAVIAPAGRLTGTPSYVFYENEAALLTNKYVYALCTKFITPECYRDQVPKKKHVTYKSIQQMAFLHPEFLHQPTVKRTDNIFLRLVSKESSHDQGMGGIRDVNGLLTKLQALGTPLTSRENRMNQEYRARDFHSWLGEAKLVVGESPTVCAEASCLGIPSIYISESKRGFIDDLESTYGLVHQLKESDLTLERMESIISKDYSQAHSRLIQENLNVTNWMIEYFSKELNLSPQRAASNLDTIVSNFDKIEGCCKE